MTPLPQNQHLSQKIAPKNRRFLPVCWDLSRVPRPGAAWGEHKGPRNRQRSRSAFPQQPAPWPASSLVPLPSPGLVCRDPPPQGSRRSWKPWGCTGTPGLRWEASAATGHAQGSRLSLAPFSAVLPSHRPSSTPGQSQVKRGCTSCSAAAPLHLPGPVESAHGWHQAGHRDEIRVHLVYF